MREVSEAPQLGPGDAVRAMFEHAMANPLDAEALFRLIAVSEDAVADSVSECRTNPWTREITEDQADTQRAMMELDQDSHVHGLEEGTAVGDNGDEDQSAEDLVRSRLLEFQVFLKYRLVGRAHMALIEAYELAKRSAKEMVASDSQPEQVNGAGEETSSPEFERPSEEERMHPSDRQLQIVHRLLSLVETIQDTRLITLHDGSQEPWAAFVTHQGRLCFGAVVGGEFVHDETLKRDVPEMFARVNSVQNQNLLELQERVGASIGADERRALTRQMSRAFLKLSELPSDEAFRVKRVRVAIPDRVATFSPAEVYADVCRVFSAQYEVTPSPIRCFEDLWDVQARFKLMSKQIPLLLESSERLSVEQLTEFAKNADQFGKVCHRFSPTGLTCVVVPIGDAFWVICQEQGDVSFARFALKHMGRVTNWCNTVAKNRLN